MECRASATALIEDLRMRGLTLAAAESFTSGWVCSLLSEPSGAPDVFLGGVVAGRPEVEQSVLGVRRSAATGLGPAGASAGARAAELMADRVRLRLGSDVGVAVTGTAGPTDEGAAPVGIVHVAVATADRTVSETDYLLGDRPDLRRQATMAALELVRRSVLGAGRRPCTPVGRG